MWGSYSSPRNTSRSQGTSDSVEQPPLSCRTLVDMWESRSKVADSISVPATPRRSETHECSSSPKSSLCEGLTTPEECHPLRRQESLPSSERSDLSAAAESVHEEQSVFQMDGHCSSDIAAASEDFPGRDGIPKEETDAQSVTSVEELKTVFGRAVCPSCGTSFW